MAMSFRRGFVERWLLLAALLLVALATMAMVFLAFKSSTTPPKQRAVLRAYAPMHLPAPTSVANTYSAQLVFMGDTMLARGVGTSIQRGGDPYEHVRALLNGYDLRIANIETVIADPAVATLPRVKSFTFNSPLAAIPLLQRVPIDVSVLANNHTSDFGPAATSSMLDLLKAANLKTVGAGKNIDEAFTPLLVDVSLHGAEAGAARQQVRIGFIALDDIETNITNATAGHAGGAYFDKTRLAASIASAKQQGAELVIAVVHWCTEYQQDAFSGRQTQIGQWLIDNGADAVIGGHPHVIQPTVTYKGKPIVYSMGNFIFNGMDEKPGATRGQMIAFNVTLTTETSGLIVNRSPATLSSPGSIRYTLNAQGFPVPD
jgi:hypothetical protein